MANGLKLNPLALGYSVALIGVLLMLVLSIVGLLGYAAKLVEIMQAHHIWYSLSFGGIVAGMAEAAIFGLALGYLVAWMYNKFV